MHGYSKEGRGKTGINHTKFLCTESEERGDIDAWPTTAGNRFATEPERSIKRPREDDPLLFIFSKFVRFHWILNYNLSPPSIFLLMVITCNSGLL